MLQNLTNQTPTRVPRKTNSNIRLISASSSERGFYVTVVFRGGKTRTFSPSMFSVRRLFDALNRAQWHAAIEYHSDYTWYSYFNPVIFDAPRVMRGSLVIHASSTPQVV